MPDRGTGETVDHLDPHCLGRGGGLLHLLGGPPAHLLWFAVAPDLWGEDGLVPLVDQVADRLAHQVVADGPDLEAVLGQDIVAALAVAVLFKGLVHLEVVAPAGQFQAVVPPFAGHLGQLLQGQVGPLAGKECHRSSRHGPSPCWMMPSSRASGLKLAALPAGVNSQCRADFSRRRSMSKMRRKRPWNSPITSGMPSSSTSRRPSLSPKDSGDCHSRSRKRASKT